MQASLQEGVIRLDFNYNNETTEKIKRIPGWRFFKTPLGAYWTIPLSGIQKAKDLKILNEGTLYPGVKQGINATLFTELNIGLKQDRLKAEGSTPKLIELEQNIKELCSYEEQLDDEYVRKTLVQNIYFSNKTIVLRFPRGLYARIKEFLSLFRFKQKNLYPVDNRPEKELEVTVSGFTPRSYQKTACTMIQEGKIDQRATLVMATGAGKTILSAIITANLGVPTIFYTYSLDLLEQTAQVYEKALGIEIGRVGGRKFTIKPITIASIQTVHSCWEKQDKRWKKLQPFLEQTKLMFIDEGHMLGAETIFNVAQITDAFYSYALTATPYREDGKEIFIEAATGPTVEIISEKALLEEGHILPVHVEILPVMHYKCRKKQYQKLYETEIVDHWERNRKVIKAIRKYPDKQVIVLVKSIYHGTKIAEIINVPFIHGSSSTKERQKAIEDFKKKKINILIASSILKQGIDLPEAEVLILAHGGRSIVELLQKIGRVRRPAPGKTCGIVVDFYDYIQPYTENDVFKAQSERRLALYRSQHYHIEGQGNTKKTGFD